ncbi:MAG: MOSC domain-containing protein [Bacteroidota bacterium]
MTMKEMMDVMPQTGKVEWISIRPEKRGVVKAIEEVQVNVENGLEGDHYGKKGGKRMITLIQAEHIATVEGILQKTVDPKLLRRNIVVSGINLLALKDRVFQVGESVQLKTTGLCHPCSRMETNLGEGGYNAMRGHGGITCMVLRGGNIRLGDAVRLLVEEEEKK